MPRLSQEKLSAESVQAVALTMCTSVRSLNAGLPISTTNIKDAKGMTCRWEYINQYALGDGIKCSPGTMTTMMMMMMKMCAIV